MEFQLRLIQSSGTAFFAGALSLVSQIIGLRMATRELSAAELTIASILVSALAGLSLGAFVFGRMADRGKQPLRQSFLLLGLASIAVLVFALLGRSLALQIRQLNLPEFIEAFCFSLITILPINVLLGSIVPVLTKAAQATKKGDVQTAFGWIYAIETLGAAIGSLAITFWAIPTFGVQAALLATAGFVLAWSLFGLVGSPGDATNEIAKSEKSRGTSESSAFARQAPSMRWVLFLAALASSCASLGMELVWQRYFGIVFGSDSHSYAIVATMFLAGNSIGSFASSRLFRFQNASLSFYRWQMLLVSGSILTSIWMLSYGFQLETLQSALAWLDRSPLPGRLLMAAMVLLLPAILIGSALPVLVKIWVAGRSAVGSRAGEIYACVIIGNVIGVLACASWLVPTFGLQNTAVILALVCLAVSVGLFFHPKQNSLSLPSVKMLRGISQAGYWGLAVAVIGLTIHLVQSPFRPGLPDDGTWIVDHYVEEASHTVAVIHAAADPDQKKLVIDGVTIGESAGGVDEKQHVLAHLPFMIGNTARPQVLTIGLGTGILAGELVEHPQVESVTCVELSKPVIDAANWFGKENRNVLENPKLKLVHGDGVRFLRNSETLFDVIVSDGKSRPGAASNLPFFSQEYYEICADSLSEQGVFVQWVSLRCDRKELETILATFCGHFPYGHVGIAAPDAVYLVGTRMPLSFDVAQIQSKMDSELTAGLRAYSWAAADDFLSMYWLDQLAVKETFADLETNTFDHPVLEKFAWRSFRHSLSNHQAQIEVLLNLIDQKGASLFNSMPLQQSEWVETVAAGRSAARELIQGEAIRIKGETDWLDRSTIHFKKALTHLPSLNRQSHVADDFRGLADQAVLESDVNTEFSALLNISELKCSTPDEELRMATILEQKQVLDKALQHYFLAVNRSKQHPKFLVEFGEALLRQRRQSHALTQFDRALKKIKDKQSLDQTNLANLNGGNEPVDRLLQPRATLLKGVVLQKLGQDQRGLEMIREVLDAHPQMQDLYQRYAFQ